MLSIIIVSYNTHDLLDQCLASIETHCHDAEVIVVDNGSKDASCELVRNKYPKTKLVEANANLGFARANNSGIEKSSGDYVLLLNSDTVLEDDSLSRCVQFMDANPKLGAISPSLIGIDDQPQRAYHAFPTMRARVARAFSHNAETRIPEPGETGWLAGTALMIRREALNDIGGTLDRDYRMYWEDADTSAELLEKGWEVAEFTDAHIRHYGGASGGGPDAARRSDLYAHYAWGEHRWFCKHRPLIESAMVWTLDFLDLFRKTLRGLIRPSRRSELTHARVLGRVLMWRIIGRRPPIPG